MPYLKPKTQLRALRPLLEEDFNDFIQPPANKVQGALNEHDFVSAAASGETVAEGAFYRHHLVAQNVDRDFIGSNTPKVGGNGPDSTFVLVNDKQWHTVTGATISASVEDSILWLAGFLQYTYQDWTKSAVDEMASVQFDLRVDGEILEEAITGKWEQTRKAWNPMRVSNPKSDTSFIGARTPYEKTPHSLGAQHRPVRLGYLARMSPGTHTLEIVAKRVSHPDRLAFKASDDYIEVFTRRLYGMEIPAMAQGGATGADAVNANYLDDGTPLSKAAYETNRLDRVISAYNSIKAGNLAKGSLNHNHLPSSIFQAEEEHLAGTLHSLDSEYPGYASATIGDPGWTQIFDGAGNLELAPGGGFPFTTYGTCYLVVMADIEISKVYTTEVPIDPRFNNFGMLCLMARYGGAWNVLDSGATECDFNAHYTFNTVEEADMNLCVSLLWVIKLTNPAQNYDKIGLFGATWDGAGGNKDVTFGWRNASLKALVLRP